MKNPEQELKNYYRSKRLAPHRVAAIQSLTHQTDRIRHRASYLIPLTTIVLLAIGIGLWLHIGVDGNLTKRIVAEIEYNHRQHGALMVESDRYGVVQAALGELDFPIRPRRNELVKNFTLIGGKYCSIQGSRAAQLKLTHNNSGIIYTLYVLPMADGTKSVKAGVYETNGVKVELWTDQSLLYGLARSQ